MVKLLFDVLHIQDARNCYPYHIMISDLIATSKPTDLMDTLCRSRSFAAPSTYWAFRNIVAVITKTKKDAGDPPGLLPSDVPTAHLDNLEQYQR